jgi:N-acetylmuramoyl-L-alanine amidase
MAYLRTDGHLAHLTRDTDQALAGDKGSDLEERCRIERTWRPGLTVSIHCNAAMAATARGFEVFTSVGETRSDAAAECIINEFHKAFPLRPIRRDFADGDQDKEARFRVLTGTFGPAVLVELGFLTNAEENDWLKMNQIKIVRALTAGIDAFAQLTEGA